MTRFRESTFVASFSVIVNVAVAITINLLTSSWSWLLFSVLAVLSAIWVGLEVRRTRAANRSEPAASSAVPPLPAHFIDRPQLTDQVVQSVTARRSRNVALTTALEGAGGFGKTTVAIAVCHRAEVRHTFGDRVYWVTLGQEVSGATIAERINDVVERITGQRPGLTSAEQAGQRLGDELRQLDRSLLVIDDVWSDEQLRPFLAGGPECVRLVTTRVPGLLPAGTVPHAVDQMRVEQARALVCAGLEEPVGDAVDRLLEETGKWPLLLELANGQLRRAHREGADIVVTIERIVSILREVGPTALDISSPVRRQHAVRATMESSLQRLDAHRGRVLQLAVFREDAEIPQELVGSLWGGDGGLDPQEVEALLRDLADLSIISYLSGTATLRIHDEIRNYLRHEYGAGRLADLHKALLEQASAGLAVHTESRVCWWELSPSSEYLWRHLAYHLGEAEGADAVADVVTDPRWVIQKLRHFGPGAIAEDLSATDTPEGRELRSFFEQTGHVLTVTDPAHAVVNTLAHRLENRPSLQKLQKAALREVHSLARLVPRRALPDLPDGSLQRVLVGHQDQIDDCVFSPDGRWLATASRDGTVRIWEVASGRTLQVLEHGDELVFACSISPDGRWLATGGSGATVRIWSVDTWTKIKELRGHKDWIRTCAFSSDGALLATAGDDSTVRLWNVSNSFQQEKTLQQEKHRKSTFGRWWIQNCTFAPEGGPLVTVSHSQTRIWHSDADYVIDQGGSALASGGAKSDARWVAIADEHLVIHDLDEPNRPQLTILQPASITAICAPMDAGWLATCGEDGVIRFWDTRDWSYRGMVKAHTGHPKTLSASPDGRILACVGSQEHVVRLLHATPHVRELAQPAVPAQTCVALADGELLAVGIDGGVLPRAKVVLFDAETLHEVETLERPDYTIGSLGAQYDQARLVEKSGREIRFSDTANWHALHVLQNPLDTLVYQLATGGSLIGWLDYENHICLCDTVNWRTWLGVWKAGDFALRETAPTAQRTAKPSSRIRRGIKTLGAHLSRNKPPELYAFDLSPDGTVLALPVGNIIKIIRCTDSMTLATLPGKGEVDGLGFSSDGGRMLVSRGNDLEIYCTDRWEVAAVLSDMGKDLKQLDVSPSGDLLVCIYGDRTVCVIDLVTGARVTEMRLDGSVEDCAWSSNNRLAVVGDHGVYWFDYVAAVSNQSQAS